MTESRNESGYAPDGVQRASQIKCVDASGRFDPLMFLGWFIGHEEELTQPNSPVRAVENLSDEARFLVYSLMPVEPDEGENTGLMDCKLVGYVDGSDEYAVIPAVCRYSRREWSDISVIRMTNVLYVMQTERHAGYSVSCSYLVVPQKYSGCGEPLIGKSIPGLASLQALRKSITRREGDVQ